MRCVILQRMMTRLARLLPFAAVAAVLLAAYLPTLQTIPNGSDHYYMIDVGETQVVLNVWGTLHATGYPLYVMSGNVLTAAFRLLGAAPAVAPALVSMLWGFVALGLIYTLALHLTGRVAASAAVTLLYGLTRTVWIHQVIAEIYSFGLMLLALLLLLALWRGNIRGRIYWLALVGGIGVAHHRALAMVAPALLFAVWPEFTAQPRRIPRIVLLSLMLGLLGFAQYAYLPLREWAGGAWAYGEPGTWAGLWAQFSGQEASRFMGVPSTLDGLWANIALVNKVLITDLTLPGLLLGVAGLLLAGRLPRYRRPALALLLSELVAYAFHIAFYRDILSALILPVTLSAAFGWLLGAAALMARYQRVGGLLAGGAAALLAATLWTQNQPFIDGLTENPTGLETIELARETPPGAALMLAWGPRHFAVGFAKDVLGELSDIRLVDHKADFAALVAEGRLVTPPYTFYNQPIAWWQERLGSEVFLRAAAPNLVEIDTTPEMVEGVTALDALETSVECRDDTILLRVTWAAPEMPAEDWSVFVHLLDESGALLAQADQSAPVYGWRPLTTWLPGEAIRDIYPLPRVQGAAAIRFGLYHQLADGTFKNEVEHRVVVACGG